MFVWTKWLSVGNRMIDGEHRKLHGIISKMACSIAARDVVALSEAFELLESSLRTYFAIEEDIARAVNFDFTQHKLAHQHLLNEFQRIRGDLASRNGMWSDAEGKNYAHSLMRCLVRHIEEDGKPLKIVLDTHLYDFRL